jgi:hypothetical protein
LVARNLKDAALPRLSPDNRLGLSYEAGLILAKMAVACAGFRVKGTAHHKTMFEVLPLAMGDGVQDVTDFLERCRRERNAISDDAAGTVSASEAAAAPDRSLMRSATSRLGWNAGSPTITRHCAADPRRLQVFTAPSPLPGAA